jgi:xanthine dehydrogenase accessory factor
VKLADLAVFNVEAAARRPAVLVTDLSAGTQRVVRADAVSRDPLAALIDLALRSGRSARVRHEARDYFLQIHVPEVRLVVVGAVHIAQALAEMARLVEVDVTIIDPRTAFAAPERFPQVKLVPKWPDEAFETITLDAYTAVALLTHDPKIDDAALKAALAAECFYIGALGSRKTHAKRLDRMRAEGFGETELARIHAPIGLDIGAVTPAEIAVAILGEIIAARGRKPARVKAEVAA